MMMTSSGTQVTHQKSSSSSHDKSTSASSPDSQQRCTSRMVNSHHADADHDHLPLSANGARDTLQTTPMPMLSQPFSLAGLPTFAGTLQEDFHLWIYQFLAFCRVHDISDEGDTHSGRRNDLLLLAMVKDSVAERYLLTAPPEYRMSWKHSLAALQQHFASPSRQLLTRQAALNALYARAFRDERHRGESVRELISDFEKDVGRAGLDERETMQMFFWVFRKYTAASRMLQRAMTLDEAFKEALRWEKVLVEKTWSADPSPT